MGRSGKHRAQFYPHPAHGCFRNPLFRTDQSGGGRGFTPHLHHWKVEGTSATMHWGCCFAHGASKRHRPNSPLPEERLHPRHLPLRLTPIFLAIAGYFFLVSTVLTSPLSPPTPHLLGAK